MTPGRYPLPSGPVTRRIPGGPDEQPLRLLGDALRQPPAGRRRGVRPQFDEDGYLLFRQVLDRGWSRTSRHHARGAGPTGGGWNAAHPISSRCLIARCARTTRRSSTGTGHPASGAVPRAFDEPALLDIVRQVLGETAFPHPLKIARIAFPTTSRRHAAAPGLPEQPGHALAHAAGPDHPHGGGAMGGLAILRGSHSGGGCPWPATRGRQPLCRGARRHGRGVPLGHHRLRPGRRPAVPVAHRARGARQRPRVRPALSVDFRYQLEARPSPDRAGATSAPHLGPGVRGLDAPTCSTTGGTWTTRWCPSGGLPLENHDGSTEFTRSRCARSSSTPSGEGPISPAPGGHRGAERAVPPPPTRRALSAGRTVLELVGGRPPVRAGRPRGRPGSARGRPRGRRRPGPS